MRILQDLSFRCRQSVSGVREVSIKTLATKSNKIEQSLQSIYSSNKSRKSDFGKLRWEFELLNVFDVQGQPNFTHARANGKPEISRSFLSIRCVHRY